MTRARQATVGSFDPATHSGTLLLDDGTPLTFDASAFDASGFRLLHSGQRVRVELADGSDRVLGLQLLYR